MSKPAAVRAAAILVADQAQAAAIQAAGGSFILTCKPTSHRTVTEYLYGAKLAEHRETVLKRGKRTTTVYRWLADVPLRDSADALPVTWFSIEMFDAKGKRTYHNSFVTDLPVSAGTVADLAACGRALDRTRERRQPQPEQARIADLQQLAAGDTWMGELDSHCGAPLRRGRRLATKARMASNE